MKLKTNTYVLIADSGKYLLLRNEGTWHTVDLRAVERAEHENPPTHEQGSDRPGRVPTTHKQYSAVADTDWHQLSKTRSAHELADRINALSDQPATKDIVLVADSSTLGIIRPLLSTQTKSFVRAEVAKDLTNHPLPRIEQILRSI